MFDDEKRNQKLSGIDFKSFLDSNYVKSRDLMETIQQCYAKDYHLMVTAKNSRKIFFDEQQMPNENVLKEIQSKIEMRKKVSLSGLDANQVSLEELLDTVKVGMKKPQEDLDHLKDFHRVTTALKQQIEFEPQDAILDKFYSFLHYLTMVKLETYLKPHTYSSDLKRLFRGQKKWSPAHWLNYSINRSKLIYHTDRSHSLATKYTDVQRQNVNLSLLQPNTIYYIWDRVAMEEILTVREQLQKALDCRDKNDRKTALAITFEIVREALIMPNENFENSIANSGTDAGDELTVTKMELLKEAQTFATLLSNTENIESFGIEAKVQTSLALANLTVDVNHVLGAIIYLLQSYQEDLEALVQVVEPPLRSQTPEELQQTLNASILTVKDLDFSLVAPNLRGRKRAKSVDFTAANFSPLLAPDEVSDVLSHRVTLRQPARPQKPEPQRNLESLKSLSEAELAAKLVKLGSQVDLSHILKKDMDQAPNLMKDLKSKESEKNKVEFDTVGNAYILQSKEGETEEAKDMTDEETRPNALAAIVLLARILLTSSDCYVRCNLWEYECFARCLFAKFSINQKKETFLMLNRLANLLLQVGSLLKEVVPENPTDDKLSTLYLQLQYVGAMVTELTTVNLSGLFYTKNGQKLDEFLKAGPKTQFSHLDGSRSSHSIFMDTFRLMSLHSDSIQDEQDKMIKLTHIRLQCVEKKKFEKMFRSVTDLSKPEAIHRVIQSLKSEKGLNRVDTDLCENGLLHRLVVDYFDVLMQREDYSFDTTLCRKELEKIFIDCLGSDQLKDYQKVFVQKYLATKLIQVVETKQFSRFKHELTALIKSLTALKPTEAVLVSLYQVMMIALMKKELMSDAGTFEPFFNFIKDVQSPQAKLFMKEIILIKETKVVMLMDANNCSIEGSEELDSMQAQIMQSQLLRGGLPLHLFHFFSKNSITQMQQDAREGSLEENEDILSELQKALDVGDDKDQFLAEDEKFFHSVIHEGKSIGLDMACETMQAGLKQRGGPVASYAQAGKEDGMALTRAAFAVMTKFQDLLEPLKQLSEELDIGQEFSIPKEKGSERTQALLDVLIMQVKGDELIECWANATKMRRWLIQKKQSIAEKLEFADEREKAEKEALSEIITKVVKKAEFLSILQSPETTNVKSDNGGLQQEKLKKRPSMMTKSLSQVIEDDTIFELKQAQSNERSKQVLEAGSISVLACLQTPITVEQIVNYIALSTRKAIRRLSGFQIIHKHLAITASDPNLNSLFSTYASWINSYKDNSVEFMHYTDGLRGCGSLFENKLKCVYQSIMKLVGEELGRTEDPRIAKQLLQSFNCKFSSTDFQFLVETVNIFPLLFRGIDGVEKSVISKSVTFHHENEEKRELSKQLQETFQEIFCAILGRISQGDAVKQMEIKQEGFTAVPKLMRKMSLLDIDWTEKIVLDALQEMITVFQTMIEHHRKIDAESDQIFAKMTKVKSKKHLKTLHKIICGDKVKANKDELKPSSPAQAESKEEEEEKSQPLEETKDCEKVESADGGDKAENFGENEDKKSKECENDAAKENNSDKGDSEKPDDDDKLSPDMTKEEVLRKVKQTYNKEMGSVFIDGHLSLICLMSNVSQIEQFPRKILNKIASDPQHITVLLQLFLICESQQQMALIFLFESLLKNSVSQEVFDKATEADVFQGEKGILAGIFAESPFAAFLLHQIVQIRLGKELALQDSAYDTSQKLLKLLLVHVCTEKQIQTAMEKAVLKLTELDRVERQIVFDILGCSLEKFCLGDEVEYHRKKDLIFTPLESRMTITDIKLENDKSNLKVYSQSVGKVTRVRKSKIQRVSYHRVEITPPMMAHLTEMLGQDGIDYLSKAQIVKYFLKSGLKDGNECLQLSQTLLKVQSELAMLPQEAKMNFVGNKTRQVEEVKWLPESLSTIILEEYLAQRIQKATMTKKEDGDEEVKAEGVAPPFEKDKEEKVKDDAKQSEEVKKTLETEKVEPTLVKQSSMVKSYYRRSQASKATHVPLNRRDGLNGLFKIDSQFLNLDDYFQRPLITVERQLIMVFIMRPEGKWDSLVQLLRANVRSNLPGEDRKAKQARLKSFLGLVFQRDCWVRFGNLAKVKTLNVCLGKLQDTLSTLQFPHLDSLSDLLDDLRVEQKSSIKQAELEYYHMPNDQGEFRGYGEGEGEGREKDSDDDDGEDGCKNVKQKVLHSVWDDFQVQSKIQFQKLKQPQKGKSYIELALQDKERLEKHLIWIEKDGELVKKTEDCMAMRILTLRFVDRLLYTMGAHPDVIQTYLDQKLAKISNYGFAMWAKDPKGIENFQIEKYFAAQSDLEKVMNLPQVSETFWWLDQFLIKDSNLRLTNYSIVAKLDMLRRFVHSLVQSQSVDAILPHAQKLVDGLLKGVWWLTNQTASGEQKEKGTLQLRIRKLLGSLIDLITKLGSAPVEMVKQGVLLRILQLDSLEQLNKLVPERYLDIRNLFQLLLVESYSLLIGVSEAAQAKDTTLEGNAVQSLSNAVKPIEKVARQMRYVRECLKDTHLIGAVRNTVEVVETTRSFILDENYPDKVGQDWFKVETNIDDVRFEFKRMDKDDDTNVNYFIKQGTHEVKKSSQNRKKKVKVSDEAFFKSDGEPLTVKYVFTGEKKDRKAVKLIIVSQKIKVNQAALPEVTETLIKQQEFLHRRWTCSVDAQFHKKSTEVFEYISKHKGDYNFVIKFYQQFVKMPQLGAEVLPAEWKDSKLSMERYVQDYLATAQLLYDLVPLMATLGDDPYLQSYANGYEQKTNYYLLVAKTHSELIKRAILQKICSHLPYKVSEYGSQVKLRIRRIKASNFKLTNRHEQAGENFTIFTQAMNCYKNFEKWKIDSNSPFHCRFINESSIDCGGPRRDCVSNLCMEVMSDVLPLLTPTGNNKARVEPSMHCYQLNPKSKEPFMLKKFMFLGYFLGWSLRNMGGLAIDLPISLWRRICKGSENYTYTLADFREMDAHRAEFLSQIEAQSKVASEEDFAIVYDGYTFEGSFNLENDIVDIELCPDGAKIPLTRSNAERFVELYLKKLSELEQLQFERIFFTIQDTVGERMLSHLTPQLAISRACSKGEISAEVFKGSVTLPGDDAWLKWFWEIFDEMDAQDKQLMLKFMSGSQRINQGTKYMISIDGEQDAFPMGHTCSNYMTMPKYSSKEIMQSRMLTAFRLCGEIDADGQMDHYGAEDPDDSNYDDENNNEDGRGGDLDDNSSVASVRLRQRHFPVYRSKDGKNEVKSKKGADLYKLEELDSDDVANRADLEMEQEFENLRVRL